MDTLSSFFGRNGFLPHGYCFTWTPGLLWSMVGADLAIALAYFSIPVAIGSYIRQRKTSLNTQVGWLFVAFIFACGTTHLMDVWTIWTPDYGLQVVTKIVTAVISVVTAIKVWPLIPLALKIPSVSQLQGVITNLENEVNRRKAAEEHVVDISQSLAATLGSIGAGFIVTDKAGHITRMNALAERLTGWSQADATGRALLTVFVPEGDAANQGNWVGILAGRDASDPTAERMVVIGRDGHKTSLEVNAAYIQAEDGSVRGMTMVLRDITLIRQAEVEIQRLAAIVESSSDAIIGKKLNGEITSWNKAAETLFGYTADEAIGQPVQMLIPLDRTDEEMRIIANITGGEVVQPFSTIRRTKSGEMVEVSATISPIRDGLGRITGASKIERDITKQNRADAALRESEARFRFTVEAARIGDWELDLQTGLARRSLRHDQCFGYDEIQPEWSFDIFLQHVHPDDRQEVTQIFNRAIVGTQDFRVECRVIWPDGSIHWIHTSGKMIVTPGKPSHMRGIVLDTTATKVAEEIRLRSQRLELENRDIRQASELKSQFLANMSHELRTPLTSIIGFAELLHKRGVPFESPKYQTFLGHIGTSGHHLLGLINGVLDLAKVESGKFEFFAEPVDLGKIINDAVSVQEDAARRGLLSLEVDIDPGLTGIVLDPTRFRQVLYNYLSNAIKFTLEGGRVTVRAAAEGSSHFRLEVEDTGIGISPADLPRLFVEFQQLDSHHNKKYQGTGLGLALTRHMVQAQGGSVGVRSTPGKGSVFYLVLPRVVRPDTPGAPL